MEDKKSAYFKMDEALDDVNYAYGAKDKAVSTLKLLGKGLFNAGRFAVAEVLPAAMEQSAKLLEKNPNATDDQREKARESKEKAAEWREKFKQDKHEDL